MDRLLAILLASQKSSRCARFVPLLPWKRVTLFEHQLEVLERTRAESVVVVLGHRAHDLRSLGKCAAFAGWFFPLPLLIEWSSPGMSNPSELLSCSITAVAELVRLRT